MITPPPIVQSTALAPLEKRGRIMLGVLLGSFLAFGLAIDVLVAALDGVSHLLAASLRSILTVGLFYCVWIGQNWARWLTVGLFAFAFLLSIRTFMGHQNLLYLLFALFFLMIFLTVTFALTLSKAIGAFLNHQRSRK